MAEHRRVLIPAYLRKPEDSLLARAERSHYTPSRTLPIISGIVLMALAAVMGALASQHFMILACL